MTKLNNIFRRCVSVFYFFALEPKEQLEILILREMEQ